MGGNADPTEIFDKFGDLSYQKQLIAKAHLPPSDANANQILIASLLYFAENMRRNGVASQKHARSLTVATRALVVATLVLALAAILRLCGVG